MYWFKADKFSTDLPLIPAAANVHSIPDLPSMIFSLDPGKPEVRSLGPDVSHSNTFVQT